MNRNGQQPRSRIYDLTFQLPLSLLSSRKYLWTSICTPYTLQLSNHFGVNATLSSSSSEKLQDDPKSGLIYFNADEQTTIWKENSKWESVYDFLGSGEGGNKRWKVAPASCQSPFLPLYMDCQLRVHFIWIARAPSDIKKLNSTIHFSLQHFRSSEGPPA